MADRTQLKIADKNDFADEDPFAELTRIMGFDPRQPVVRQDVGAPADRVEPTVDDDFGIDLEKELLGELAGDDLVAEPERIAHDAYIYANQPAAYAPVESPVAYAPAEERAREPEFASDASFDDAVAASFEDFSLEDELLRPEEPAYAAVPAYDQAPEVGFAPEPTFAPEPAFATEPPFAPEPDFDDAVAASFEQEFSMEDELLAADEPAAQVAAPVSYAASTEVDLDAEFDVALADVDMDFAAVDDDSYAAEAVEDDHLTLGEYQAAEPEIAFSHADLVDQPQAVAAPVAQAGDYDEFERRLQDALRDEEPAYEPAVAYAAPAVEPVVEAPVHAPEVAQVAAPVAAVEDTSLEDELNALLGNMSSQAKALSEPVPLRVVEPVAVEPEPTFASALWAPEQPAEEPTQAYEDTDYATAYDAPVEEFVAADEAAPVQADAGYSEPSYDHQADIDVSFDDDAFDMALERSAAAEVSEVAAPAIAAAAAAVPMRPLAASRYEQARNWGLGTPVAPRAAAPVVAAQSSYQPEAIQKPDAYMPVAPTYEPQTEPVAYAPEAYAPQAEPEAYAPAEPAVDDLEAELFAAVSSFDDAPDIETVDVPEKAVALADDLDIPELSFEDDAPPAPAFDDLDGEFSNLMNEMNAPEVTKPAGSSNYASNPYADGFDRKTLRDGDASQPIELAGAAAAGAAAMYAGRQVDDRLGGFDLGGMQQSQANAPRQQAQADEFDYDPDFDEAMEALPGSPAARPVRRGMMIAAIVGAVAVVGGIGAFALSFGGGEGAGAPVIVKADESPIKVKPENPGGATVPNQDSKVYDRVAGGSTNGAPAQDKLVTNAEEPVDLAAQEAEANMPENLPLNGDDVAAEPTAKSEERVAQAPQTDQPDASTETAAVAPRKVRTMVVRPDGTLVPREEPAPAVVAAAEPTDPAPQRVAEPASEATGTVPAQPALAPVAKPAQSANTPSTAPIAPQRPSEQPVDVVGEVKPDQVAAVAPTAPTTAAASGAWAMQIASQPSEAAAKSTYADLARRYGSVLNGREVSIVKAEIAGKGTFWRVRVPAGTRNDAVSLCESYKAAGGNCFVSK
ncbi:sporulation related protein [Aminobacter aminovorans]|uniref:Sporulation related domain n=1 Tax=Aminobacter aminovorans TaxID=83263 RepID=A0A380WMZ1_AMIAI|nr:SPOR domain-containing protein [Aminobacter aminovorans]TCS26126.1 sporulation related protein [Aminobacter aminovorans]SUU90210.1 Sporulation related domain [Aminobacter aminovorans]